MKSIIRTQKISIEKPTMDDDAWITFILQAVQLDPDGNRKAVSGRVEQLHRRGPDIMGETVTFINPMTQQQVTLSGLEIQMAIAALSAKWIVEDAESKGKSAYINDEGSAVVEDF